MLTEKQLREAQKQINHENWIHRQKQWGEILGGWDHREEERSEGIEQGGQTEARIQQRHQKSA